MQVKAQRLREAMMLLDAVVPRKAKVKSLSNVFLKDGKISATDLDVYVSLDLPEVDVECLLPHREVHEMLKYVPGNEEVTIVPDGGAVKLKWESGDATYYPGKLEDYPVTSAFELKVKGTLNGDKFVKALMALVDYTQTDNTKPILNGVAVILGEGLELWGADGFRLAQLKVDDVFPDQRTIVIPTGTVRLLGYLWSKLPAAPPLAGTLVQQIISKRELRLGLAIGVPLPDGTIPPASNMVARFGRLTVVSKLIQGTPPEYKRVIPTESPIKLRVLGREFLTGIQRVKEIAKDSNGITRLEWADNSLTISSHSTEKGDSSAILQAQTEGGPGKTAVNIKYLLEYFKTRDGLVTISISDPKSPVLFKYSNTPMVIMMPMFVNWDEPLEHKEPVAAEPVASTEGPQEEDPGDDEEEPTEPVNEEPVETTAEQVATE